MFTFARFPDGTPCLNCDDESNLADHGTTDRIDPECEILGHYQNRETKGQPVKTYPIDKTSAKILVNECYGKPVCESCDNEKPDAPIFPNVEFEWVWWIDDECDYPFQLLVPKNRKHGEKHWTIGDEKCMIALCPDHAVGKPASFCEHCHEPLSRIGDKGTTFVDLGCENTKCFYYDPRFGNHLFS